MTYKEKYFEIINNGLKDKHESGYYERHHIVPKSICPLLKKSQDNLVYLTAKNHFLAHYYIWKWFKEELQEKKWASKMCYAFNMMKRIITKSDDIDELSKLYEEVRKDFSKVSSEANKGKNNPMYGKDWRVGKSKEELEEHNRKLSEANKGKNHPFYGKHLSEETKRKISQARKGRYCGENNPFYGKKHTEETIKKLGKPKSEEHKRKISESQKKPILQYDMSGNFIQEFSSAKDAGDELEINKGNITSCCKGKKGYQTAYGYRWFYKEDCLYFF